MTIMYTDLQKVFCPCHFSQYITPQFFQKMIVKAFFVQFEKNTQYCRKPNACRFVFRKAMARVCTRVNNNKVY